MIASNQEDGSGKPLADAARPKPKIFVFINSRQAADWNNAYAVAEDGTGITSHVSSSIGWARHDMGFDGSDWKHEDYNKHYPDGWELEWVDDPKTHPGLLAAIEKNRALAAQAASPEAKPADQREAEPSSSPAPGEGAEAGQKSPTFLAGYRAAKGQHPHDAMLLHGVGQLADEYRAGVDAAAAPVEPNAEDCQYHCSGARGTICAVDQKGAVFIRPDATNEELRAALLGVLSDEGVPLPEAPAPVEDGKRGLGCWGLWDERRKRYADWAEPGPRPEYVRPGVFGEWVHLVPASSLESMRKALDEIATSGMDRGSSDLDPRHVACIRIARAALAEAGEGV